MPFPLSKELAHDSRAEAACFDRSCIPAARQHALGAFKGIRANGHAAATGFIGPALVQRHGFALLKPIWIENDLFRIFANYRTATVE